MNRRSLLFAILCTFAGSANLTHSAESNDEAKTVAFKGGRILTAQDQIFDPGVLLIKGHKIADVGSVMTVAIPEGAQVVDVTGKVLIPGLVDTHSHLGVYSRPDIEANSDGNETSGPIQSVVRALDSINPFDPGLKMAHAGGVTTANIMPGSGNVIGGQTLYVKYRGQTVDEMRIQSAKVLGGLKMANGENPKRVYGSKGQAPRTRMKVAALQRGEFLKAREYKTKWDDYRKQLATGKEVKPPDVDLGLEALVEVLERKRTVHFHSHRADDIRSTLRLADEFGFELVVQHGTEGFKIADELAKRKVPVSMTVVDSPGGKAEVVDLVEECGAQLAKAGVKVLINTDDYITESRFFLRTAAIPVRGGLSEDLALKAITLHAAEALHLEDRVGSLAKGKDADFVVLSGSPFSVYTRVEQTYIDGIKVFDLSDSDDRLFQTGGYPLAARDLVPGPTPVVQPTTIGSKPNAPANASKPSLSDSELVIIAGTVFPVSGPPITNGVVHVKQGKIVAVAEQAGFNVPQGAAVLAARAVTPGLIDSYSVVPLAGEYNIPADQDSDESSDPNQADVRVLDGFNPREPLMRFLLEQGVTVVHASPGPANVIAGQSGVFRTHGNSADAMAIRFPHAMVFNLGSGVKETYPEKKPDTRMGTAALVRSALSQAAVYHRKATASDDGKRPDFDLKSQALAKLLKGEVEALFAAQRSDDLMTGLRLMKEFDLKGTLALAADGYLIADQLAESKVPVIVHPTMQRIGSPDSYNSYLGNAAVLSDKGILTSICSGVEGYVPKTRVVRHEAAMAMVYGLGFQRALKAITLDAARILKIDKDYGSLDSGKVADLVLYDGDPFEHTTHVTHVLVDGKVVHDRAERAKTSFARRFYFASPQIPCCLGW